MYYMQCLRFGRNLLNTLGNVINRIFYVLDSEIWSLFHFWDRIFDIFTSANHKWNKFHIQCQTIKYPLYFYFLFRKIENKKKLCVSVSGHQTFPIF